MPGPQQPELARSRKGATSDRSAKAKLSGEGVPVAEGPTGPIPEESQPGQHPEVEQVKLLGDETPREGLLRIAQLGEAALKGADATGVTLLDGDRPKTFAFTNEKAPEVDHLQYSEGDGPSLTCYRERKIVRVTSNRTEERWPAFTRRAVEKGVLSSLSIPLVVNHQGLGALNFYGQAEGAFSAEDERVAMVFAEQASVVVANAQAYWGARELSTNLDGAMRSRAVIEQAKGVLMARFNLPADVAFDELRQIAQAESCTLREAAEDLVASTKRNDP